MGDWQFGGRKVETGEELASVGNTLAVGLGERRVDGSTKGKGAREKNKKQPHSMCTFDQRKEKARVD
jgi:hypothetical protein